MAIVKPYDKRSGITYAYEATYRWNKEKKQSRCTRKLIGRIDDKTGDIIPTDGRCRKDKTAKSTKPSKREPVPVTSTRHMYYGATYLLEDLMNILVSRNHYSGIVENYIQNKETAFGWLNYHS